MFYLDVQHKLSLDSKFIVRTIKILQINIVIKLRKLMRMYVTKCLM